jgi:hypothetical protein
MVPILAMYYVAFENKTGNKIIEGMACFEKNMYLSGFREFYFLTAI